MRRVFAFSIIIVLVFLAFTGCGSEKPKQTEQDVKSTTIETSKPVESQNTADDKSSEPIQAAPSADVSLLAATGKSAELPNNYPSGKFPIYEESFIYSVIELDGSYTLTVFSKDAVKKVIAFYEKVLEGAEVIMDTKTDESLTSFGTKDGYTYNMDMGKSSEMEGYPTSITIILQPVNEEGLQ